MMYISNTILHELSRGDISQAKTDKGIFKGTTILIAARRSGGDSSSCAISHDVKDQIAIVLCQASLTC